MPKQTSKELATQEEKPSYLANVNFGSSKGIVGLEEADSDSYAIPFLYILQSGSPQVKKTSGSYIDGAQEGMLLDTVSGEVIDVNDEALHFVPVFYRRAYVEWVPQKEGGGFVQQHPVDTPLATQTERDEDKNNVLPNGNHLVDTRYHYVILVREDGTTQPMVIAMSSTQIKKSKKLNSDITNRVKQFKVPATFAMMYKIELEGESNDQYSWWGWKPKFAGLVQSQEVFDEARSFYESIIAGEVREATETLTPHEDDDTEGHPDF